jgi:hypothetical protein
VGDIHRGFIGLADGDRNRRGVDCWAGIFCKAKRQKRRVAVMLFYVAFIATACLFIIVLVGWLLLKLDTPGDN